jgi:hypothetical protein
MKIRHLVLVSAALLWISPARATTMVSMSLDQLAQASTAIVQGRVVEQVTGWNSARTQILTISTVAVSHAFKGGAPSTLEIQQIGGTVGNMHAAVAGDVALQAQTEYVLFLEPEHGTSRYHLVGMLQGAYHIYRDATSGEQRVILPMSQIQVGNQLLSGGNPAGTLPLDGLHQYVSTILTSAIEVPHGLNIPVAVASTESRGVGRLHVYGRTTTDLFPNRTLVIPAGSPVEGEAVQSGGTWTIHWDELDIRGLHAQVSATSQELSGNLRGKILVLRLR